jgi:hypothetical protein
MAATASNAQKHLVDLMQSSLVMRTCPKFGPI